VVPGKWIRREIRLNSVRTSVASSRGNVNDFIASGLKHEMFREVWIYEEGEGNNHVSSLTRGLTGRTGS
jgi:hypothetical protein